MKLYSGRQGGSKKLPKSVGNVENSLGHTNGFYDFTPNIAIGYGVAITELRA